MAITSASTDAQVLAEFEDNYAAALGKSQSAILACLTALGFIRLRLPQSGQFAGRAYSKESLADTDKHLRALLEAAQNTPTASTQRRVRLRLDGAGGFG